MLHAATYKCLFVQLFVYFMKLRLYPFGTSGDVPLTSANACLHSDQRGITASQLLHRAKRTYVHIWMKQELFLISWPTSTVTLILSLIDTEICMSMFVDMTHFVLWHIF